MWYTLAEGRDREGQVNRHVEEAEDILACRFHSSLLSGKLRQAFHWATDCEEGGCLLPRDVRTKIGRPIVDILHEKHPGICIPPLEIPTCAAFEECEEVPETALLDFSEDKVTWVTSKISGAAGVLRAETIELRNWIL